MRLSTFTLAAASAASLATPALADVASIQAALNSVAESVAGVKTNLDAWKGDLLGTTPIIISTADLAVTLQISTLKIKKSENLSEDEAIEIADTTAGLITNTLPTLDALAAAKPRFDRLLLTPVIYLALLSQKQSTLDLGGAVTSKLPDIYDEVGEALLLELESAFNVVIDQYQPF